MAVIKIWRAGSSFTVGGRRISQTHLFFDILRSWVFYFWILRRYVSVLREHFPLSNESPSWVSRMITPKPDTWGVVGLAQAMPRLRKHNTMVHVKNSVLQTSSLLMSPVGLRSPSRWRRREPAWASVWREERILHSEIVRWQSRKFLLVSLTRGYLDWNLICKWFCAPQIHTSRHKNSTFIQVLTRPFVNSRRCSG